MARGVADQHPPRRAQAGCLSKAGKPGRTTHAPSSTAAAAFTYQQAPRHPMSQYKLFYAEDDLDDLHIFQEALAAHPEVAVTRFADGRELLDAMEKLPDRELPCLIVLDLNMPVLDGRETLTIMRRHPRFSNIPALLFTTSNSEVDKGFALKWDVDMVTKPIIFRDMEHLANQLVALCQAPGQRG
ncbi:MAG: response regulator [Chitinophagaceae bacterium]|nr:MAG: response regulator [Chitinophagaceae bacterium]